MFINTKRDSGYSYYGQLTAVKKGYLLTSVTWLYRRLLDLVYPPPPPKKKLRNHCFQFLLGITVIPREIEDNAYVKFWGVNKVHYGLCDNVELNEWMVMCFVKLSTDQLLVFNWSWAQFQNFPLSKKLCLAFGFDGIARFILLQWTQPWMTSYVWMLKILPVFLIVFILRIAVKAYSK